MLMLVTSSQTAYSKCPPTAFWGHFENTGRYACTASLGQQGAAGPWQSISVKLTLTLTLTVTLTDTGGAVLTLMLGYRSLEKIAPRIVNTTRFLHVRILLQNDSIAALNWVLTQVSPDHLQNRLRFRKCRSALLCNIGISRALQS